MTYLRNRKGQGTLEYVLIAAAVVALAALLVSKVKPAATARITEVQTGLANGGSGN